MSSADQPFAVRPNDIPERYGVSRSSLYKLIADGVIPARKCGNITLVLDEDMQRYIRSLPTGLPPAPQAAMAARRSYRRKG